MRDKTRWTAARTSRFGPRWGPVSFALALALGTACTKPERKPPPPQTGPFDFEPDEPIYPKFDPDAVTPLDVLYFPEPVGEGYPRVPVEIGPTLHSGKWLGLANGDADFMGPRHIIVNHFRSQPDDIGEGDLIKNVLLDVETGEVVAEFAHGRYVQWHFGLAIVFKEDDDRPYLLNTAGELVLAVPEGEHEYVLNENYWLRFSPIAARLWITARDGEDTVHLYAWEQLDAPPELPNNPFPFMPRTWDPLHTRHFESADTEEVTGPDSSLACSRVVLKPPKGYECLDDLELEDTLPLSRGWRVDSQNDLVFNRHDGRGFDLSSLCPDEQAFFAWVRHRSPPTLELRCEGDPSVLMLWTAPDKVQRVDPNFAQRLWQAELMLYEHDDIGRYEVVEAPPPGVDTVFNSEKMLREIVGTDDSCEEQRVRPGVGLFGTGCNRHDGSILWFELVDTKAKRRSKRFRATELAVSPQTGAVVAIMRRGGSDRVVRVSIKSD